MTSEELIAIKSRINRTLAKRNGIGSVAHLAGDEYKLPELKRGSPLTAEIGEKTVDLLLDVVGTETYPELGKGSKSGGPVPKGFNKKDIDNICDELDKDLDDEDRGGFVGEFNGERYELPGGKDYRKDRKIRSEHNHCAASCTGVCVGSCVNMCNGCTGCFSCTNSCSSVCGGSCLST